MLLQNVRWITHALTTLALLGASTACSLRQEDQAKVRVSFPAKGISSSSSSLLNSALSGRPGATGLIGLPSAMTLDDFTCFGINVTGPEITPNPAFSSCSNPNLPYVGVVGGLASITSGSVEVLVPSGVNRTFQLFTVQSQNTIGCPAMDDSLISRFGGADISNPVQVGSTTADILGDVSINIFAAYDPLNPKPLFCPDGNGVPAKLTLAGPTSPLTTGCDAYSVVVHDSNGNPAVVGFDFPVSLSGNGAGAFYSNSDCSTSVSNVSVVSGASSALVYFKGASAATLTLRAAGSGLTLGSLPIHVILPLAISPATITMALSATWTFTASGGLAPYAYSLFSGDGAINSSTGFYTAPATSGSAIVRVTDSLGSASDSAVTINSALTISPASPVLTVNETVVFSASNGVAPYSYSITGDGAIDASTGLYTAAASAGTASVTVTDSLGNTSNATVTVNDVAPSALTYANAAATYPIGSAITNNTPSSSGGAVVSYTISPALPTGLTLNSSTGVISGTPSALSGNTAYTVTATNTGGSTNSVLNITVGSAPAVTLAVTFPASIAAGDPGSIIVTAKDVFGNDDTNYAGTVLFTSSDGAATLPVNYTFTGGDAGTHVFTNGATLTTAGVHTLTATDTVTGTITGTQAGITVTGGSASQLAFTVQPSASGIAGIPLATSPVVEIRDSFGNLVPSATDKIRLTAYADSSCTHWATPDKNPISNIVATANPESAVAGQSSFSNVLFNTPGVIYLKADGGGLSPACSNAITLSAGLPIELALVGSDTIQTNYCSREFQVRSLDSTHARIAVGSSVTVTLGGAGAGSFYLNSDCTGPTSSVTIQAGDSSASFYYYSTAAAATNFTASAAGFQPATQQVAALASWSDPSKLETDTPMGFAAGDCAPMSVKRISTNNGYTNATPGYPTTVNLATDGAAEFYSDPSCTANITSIDILAGNYMADFYAKSAVPGASSLFVQDAGGLMISRPNFLMVAGVGTPVYTGLMGGDDDHKRSLAAQSCLNFMVFALTQEFDLAIVTPVLTANLSGTGVSFYSDWDCSVPTSTSDFASGSSVAEISFAGTASGPSSITFDGSASGLQIAHADFTLSWPSPSRFDFTSATSPTSFSASTCYLVTVNAKSDAGNLAPMGYTTNVSLSAGDGSASFYSDVGCTASINSIQFAPTDDHRDVYFMAASGNSAIHAESPGIYSNGLSWSVSGGGGSPTNLNIMGASQGLINTCVGPIYVLSQDSSYNQANVGSPVTVTLGSAGLGTFYSDPGCSSPITETSISTGQSQSPNFYFYDTVAHVVSMTATAGGLSSAMREFISASSGTATYLAVLGNTNISTGMCQNFRVVVEDASYLPVMAGSFISATVAGAGSGTFYSDSNCSVPSSLVTISAGSATQEFWFKDNTVESVYFTASAGGLSGTSALNVSVNGGGSDRLSFDFNGNSLGNAPAVYGTTGQCIGPFSASYRNSSGTLTPASNAISINIGGGSNGLFYPNDSGCTTGGVLSPSTSIAIGASSSTDQFYYKHTAGTVENFWVHSPNYSSIPDGNGGIVIAQSGTPTALGLIGSTTISSGSCMSYQVVTLGAGVPVIQTSGSLLSVAISTNMSGYFFSDSSCSTSQTTSTIVSISDSSSISNVIYYKDNVSGESPTISLSSSPLALSGSQILTVTGGSGNHLAWIGPMSPAADSYSPTGCIGPYAIESKDGGNNPITMSGSSKIVTLTGGSFYADSTCLSGTSSVNIPPASYQSGNFWIYQSSATTLSVSATDNGGGGISLSGFSGSINVSTGGGAPAGLSYRWDPWVQNVGIAIPATGPRSTGGAITSYSISPSLPAGLSFNPSDGMISGTPSGTSSTTYTVTGTNGSGSTSITFTITVNPDDIGRTVAAGCTMNSARNGHFSVLLKNGKVLIGGGINASPVLTASAELYDPVTGICTLEGSMPIALSSTTATLLPDGRVLIAGGSGSSGNVATAFLYDESTGLFNATGSMMTARNGHTATLLQNGKVLIVGGQNDVGSVVATAELYDPSNGLFTTTGSMSVIRNGHSATLLDNGKVLIAGGQNGTIHGVLSSAEVYDTGVGTFFSTSNSMSNVRTGHVATRLPDGKVLLAGGGCDTYGYSCPLSTAELYDSGLNSFSATGSLTTARPGGMIATLLPNGEVLIAGGDIDSGCDAKNSTELYNPATATFAVSTTMNSKRESFSAALLPNGKVLLSGGKVQNCGGSDSSTLSSTDVYQ